MNYSFTDCFVANAISDELYKAKETEDILVFECGEFFGRFGSYDECTSTDDNRRVKMLHELVDGEEGVVENTTMLKHLRTNFRKINEFKKN